MTITSRLILVSDDHGLSTQALGEECSFDCGFSVFARYYDDCDDGAGEAACVWEYDCCCVSVRSVAVFTDGLVWKLWRNGDDGRNGGGMAGWEEWGMVGWGMEGWVMGAGTGWEAGTAGWGTASVCPVCRV